MTVTCLFRGFQYVRARSVVGEGIVFGQPARAASKHDRPLSEAHMNLVSGDLRSDPDFLSDFRFVEGDNLPNILSHKSECA